MMISMKARPGWYNTRKTASGKFEARWATETGEVKGKSFNTKPQAQKHARDMANGIVDVSLGIGVCQKDIQEALDEFLKRADVVASTHAENEYHIERFMERVPRVKTTGQLTNSVVNEYANILIKEGLNPGGRNHALKILRAFTNFCRRQKWLAANPFEKFTMPKSTFDGWHLTPAQFDAVCAVRDDGRCADADYWLNLAFRFGRQTMLRISQIWKLRPEHFRAPNEVWVDGIKGQAGVWIKLRAEALQIFNQIAKDTPAEQRLFRYWKSVDSMQWSVYEKVRKAGIEPRIDFVNGERKEIYPRFHDVCKVSGISDLMDLGFSPADIAHITNTSKRTIIEEYMQADREQSFDRFLALDGHTEPIPNMTTKNANCEQQVTQDATSATDENDASNEQKLKFRRAV